jgi:hypothetical protein
MKPAAPLTRIRMTPATIKGVAVPIVPAIKSPAPVTKTTAAPIRKRVAVRIFLGIEKKERKGLEGQVMGADSAHEWRYAHFFLRMALTNMQGKAPVVKVSWQSVGEHGLLLRVLVSRTQT